MHFAYPIQAILMYLAILFAPPEVDRITIEMPGKEPRIELVRSGAKWESEGNVFAVEKDSLVIFGTEGRETLKITDFVALPNDHDWIKNPKFTLGGGSTLEKVAAGFTVRRNAAGGEGNGVYQIRYHKPAAESERITVNVLGQVVNPGAHAMLADGTLEDAIAAAGGAAAAADMKRVSIIRGPAGSVPKVTTVDLTRVKGASPPIQAGDTIHVPASNEVAQVSEEEAQIRVLAEQWLAKTDAGEYDASWKAAAEFFQNSITGEAWSDAMKKFREPLGGMKTRKIRDVQKADALPGAPDGKYVIIQFDTAFAAKAQAVETVTFMLEEDGSWKPAGYVIR
jgi:DNA uptake protein ComE-like DNA-binding protein